MEKRYLETLMTKEAALDFGLNLEDLIQVRTKDGTFYVYKVEVSKKMYKEVNREDWKYQKRRQREFEYLAKTGKTLISLERSIEESNFEVESEIDVEEKAINLIMLEVLQEQINELPKFDKELMNLVFHTDYTQEQLSKILKVSTWKISTSIRKNMKILQKQLRR